MQNFMSLSPKTEVPGVTYWNPVAVHGRELSGVLYEPPLWSEFIAVCSKNVGVPVFYPTIDSDDRLEARSVYSFNQLE